MELVKIVRSTKESKMKAEAVVQILAMIDKDCSKMALVKNASLKQKSLVMVKIASLTSVIQGNS